MLLLTCALASVVTIQPAKTSETTTAQTQQKVGTLSEVGPPIQWNKTYGGAAFDWAWSMVRTSDGGYALAGRTKSFGAGGVDDFWLVKTDGDGNMQWSRTYGVASYYDIAYSVIQTSDGGYALVGTSGSPTNVLLVKTDSSGNMQWSRIYGGSDYDYAFSVIQTRDGGYAIAGATHISSSQIAFWLFKTDSSGNMQWSHTYGGAYADYAHSVIQTSDGGYALVGTTQPSSTAYTDVWLIKTDSYGNVLWDKKYLGTGSANDHGYSVIQTSDGGYAIAGETQVSGIPEYEMLLLKTDSNGNVQWIGKYVIGYYDRACSVIQTSDGGYAIAGYYTSENAYYGALKKIYANGTEQWERRLWDGAIVSVVQTADGGYALGGSTNKYSAGDYDFWLIKVAPETPKVDWWPMFGHDARRTGASTSTAPNTNDTLWTFEVYTTHMGGPVAADGIVFIGPESPNDKIYALNATTGELLWNVTVGGGSSQFAVSGGVVYVCNQGSHKLYAFNEFTGELLWSFTTTGNPGGPVISEGIVFFSTWWEGKIYALNALTGNLLWSWQTPAGTKAITGPAVADGMVFFSSAFDGVVYCFDEFTGNPKWNFTHGAYSDNTAAVVDGIVFIGGGSSGVFYALNETNGQLIWSYSTGADLHTSPSIHNGKVFFGATNGKVYALNKSTGSLLWSYQTGDVVCGWVIYADGKVFFTSRDRKVYALNESTGALIWSYDTGLPTDPGIPIVANGILYVPTGTWYYAPRVLRLIAFGGFKHDVAITGVEPSKTVVGQGYNMNVNVTVANQGDYTETFDVTLYAQNHMAINETGSLVYVADYGAGPWWYRPSFPDATAKWIWKNPDAEIDAPVEEFWVFREFSLASSDTITISITVDDRYWLYVDSTFIGSDANWENTESYLIWLPAGSHKLRITVSNAPGPELNPAGLILSVKDSFNNILFNTQGDGTWRTGVSGLVGYWNFDEGTGTIAHDSSGNNNDGMLMNGPTWVDGKIGKALYFDGTDDYIRIEDSATISSPSVTNAITVMAWVKPDPGFLNDRYARVVASHWTDGEGQIGGSSNAWVLEAHDDGRYHAILSAGDDVTWIDLASNTAPQEGVWQHLAFTWDGSTVTFYFNGVIDATGMYTATISDSSRPMQIAKTDLLWYVWKGFIDEVKVYNRSLSADEVWAEYTRQAGFIIGTQTVTLESGASTTLTFTWNTTGFAKGNYTIWAYAWPVPGETDTTDNTFTDGWVIVSMVGDITGPTGWPDGKVDIRDVAKVSRIYGALSGMPGWDPNCDINNDQKIDIKDVAAVSRQYGKIDP